MENLGQRLFNGGLKTTTWFDDSGLKKFTSTFNPSVRLFDEQGTEIPGALQQRMGMQAGLSDFQPGYGHAQRQALFAGMVQRALDAGWFAQFGIPAGPKVDGGTIAAGYNPEFLQDAAYLLTADGVNSAIVVQFADVQQPFNGLPQQLATDLAGLFAKHGFKHPSRFTPYTFTPAELAAAGIAPTDAGFDLYYSFIAQSLLEAGTSGDPTGDTTLVDNATFLRWWSDRQGSPAA